MSVTQVRCPACSAPVLATPAAPRTRCVYCGSPLVVDTSGGELSLQLAGRVTGAVEQAGERTRAELLRQQQIQEIAHLELRLQVVEGEMRAVERLPSSPVTRCQLADLRRQAQELRGRLATLRGEALPAPAPRAKLGGRDLVEMFFLPQGRVGRAVYWGVCAGLLLVFGLAAALNRPVANGDSTMLPAALPVLCLFWVMVWSYVVVAIKRYHDRDKSGWWVLLFLIPVAGQFWQFFELALLPGTPGANRYG